MLDETLYTECCHEAIARGIPMDSIRSYMSNGVAMASTYNHLPDRATTVWICLLTAIFCNIDDNLSGEQDIVHVYRFNERFARCQPQGDPTLQVLDTLLREAPRHYSPLMSNLITTSILDYISSLLLDHETKDMQV